ncbi:hypothetical protein [Anaerocolumna chitinilytica]|uniref:Uncharacterized protein n=1 Tax=Anaerocolumna chitinilytica TaxID=1727145 RepID=A0A7M3SAG9_9FIRM|nr:hypothetical protein [Anaerocolumna chitinilytica]BCK01587.1 hypothetical protein bsdcttw_46270 [Anaerocolumna chitinilytica]
MEKVPDNEYEMFVKWRCKIAKEDFQIRAESLKIETESTEYVNMLMIEMYKKGFSDRDVISKFIL